LAAVVLLLTAGGVVAGSGPGRPFYELRLAIERALVPAFGVEHSRAVLDHLDDRLDEIIASARAGDDRALGAALAAYRGELEGLSIDPELADVEDLVLSRLKYHASLLGEVLGRLPAQATPGLQEALERAERARDAIEGIDGEDDDGPGEEPVTEPPIMVPIPSIEVPIPDGPPAGPP
jgi:hypothetical protein